MCTCSSSGCGGASCWGQPGLRRDVFVVGGGGAGPCGAPGQRGVHSPGAWPPKRRRLPGSPAGAMAAAALQLQLRTVYWWLLRLASSANTEEMERGMMPLSTYRSAPPAGTRSTWRGELRRALCAWPWVALQPAASCCQGRRGRTRDGEGLARARLAVRKDGGVVALQRTEHHVARDALEHLHPGSAHGRALARPCWVRPACVPGGAAGSPSAWPRRGPTSSCLASGVRMPLKKNS
jgi:hypothetical protein